MMQQTIGGEIRVSGREPYGGNQVDVRILPSDENTGIMFYTERGCVEADLKYASQSISSVALDNGITRLMHVEHFLATLYAYGIDNAQIGVKTIPSRSLKRLRRFGLATNAVVLPTLHGREIPLCKEIERVGIEEQVSARRILRLDEKFHTDRLKFDPIKGDDLIVRASTNYPIPGEESYEVAVTPENYRDQVAGARSFMKHLPLGISRLPKRVLSFGASVANFGFGLGHGFEEENFFFPPRDLKEWRKREKYIGEIARHSIVDRLGAIALLGGRLQGVKVSAYRSGHENDIRVLRELLVNRKL